MTRSTFATFLVLLAACAPTGPAPAGRRVAEGLVLDLVASPRGDAFVAEMRGHHETSGDAREQLWLSRAPFESEPESLGRGATEGGFSDDGRWVAWLVSKERGDRTGPGRARRVSGGATIDLKTVMPPFVFGSAALISMSSYRGDSGRGGLQAANLASGSRSLSFYDAMPAAFARFGHGFVALQRPGDGGPCRALRLDAAGAHPIAVAGDLACAAPRLPLTVSGDGRAILLRHTGGALGIFRDGDATETPLAPEAGAWAFDASGRAWWTEARAGRVFVAREGAAIGDVEGRFARAIFPSREGGAWVLLADRRCDGGAPSPAPACARLVAVGDAPAPPDAGTVRHVVASPSGFPLAVFAGDQTPPALFAIASPGHTFPVTAFGIAAEFSRDGRYLAAVEWMDDGQRPLLLDFESGDVRTLSTGAAVARVFWCGETLLHTFETRKAWELPDTRNGIYAVTP